MATRQTRLITKNSITSGATLPNSSQILKGEAVVNLNEGILFYSGVSSGGNFTPSNYNSGYFEVGSNLYDLKIRHQIISYDGFSGASMVGKILSGTTSGLTLVESTELNGISAFTYTPSANTFTIIDSNGTSYPATFTSVSGLTVNGDFDVTGNTVLNFVTANTLSATTITVDNFVIAGDLSVNNLTVTGNTVLSATTATTISATTITVDDINVNDDANIGGDLNVTGNTVLNFLTANTISATTITVDDVNVNDDVNINGDLNVTGNTVLNFLTANTLSATTITSDDVIVNDDLNVGGDVNITGNTILNTLTANTISATTITVDDINVNDDANIGGDLNVTGDTIINSFTAGTGTINGNLTITGLSPNLVVYTNPSNVLSTQSGFGYDESNTLLTVNNLDVNNTTSAATFGVGGVVIGSGGSLTGTGTGDLIVHGSLTVFGPSISAFTSNLYIEDNNIILNYNPTGSTAPTSVNSGFQIQDGSGTSGSSVNLDVVRLQYLSGVTTAQTPYVLSEYTGDNGYINRGWITQLNDIVIRSTDVVDDGVLGSITGVRVLAEFDVLDGGTY